MLEQTFLEMQPNISLRILFWTRIVQNSMMSFLWRAPIIGLDFIPKWRVLNLYKIWMLTWLTFQVQGLTLPGLQVTASESQEGERSN